MHPELVGGIAIARLVLELVEAIDRCLDGIGRLAEFLVDEIAQVTLVGELAKTGREGLDCFVEPLEAHLDLVVAVDHDIRLLQRVHAFQAEAE